MSVGLLTGTATYMLPLEEAGTDVAATRFGDVVVVSGTLAGADVVQVARHGDGHARLSNHVDHRANVEALRLAGVTAVLATTVCGGVDPALEPGALVVFDDLYFPSNRLPDGALCTFHDRPGEGGRGHWIFDRPFAPELRRALVEAALAAGCRVVDGGCYGHVDGPRFNTRTEIRALAAAGVSAVSQTAGPEAVLCGEAGLPYALAGFVTDRANGVGEEPLAAAELERLLSASAGVFTRLLSAAAPLLAEAAAEPAGFVYRIER